MVCHPLPPPLPTTPQHIIFNSLASDPILFAAQRILRGFNFSNGDTDLGKVLGHNALGSVALLCCYSGVKWIIRTAEEGWVCVDTSPGRPRRWKRLGWADDVLKHAIRRDGGEWWWGEDGWRYDQVQPMEEEYIMRFQDPSRKRKFSSLAEEYPPRPRSGASSAYEQQLEQLKKQRGL